jgi:hypothetical protein
MATEGSPNEGLDYVAGRVYGSHLSLVAYTNAANSLGSSTVYANLTQPTGGGYAPIALDGTWSFSAGTVTYQKAGSNPRWTATGTWSATVNGVAMVDITAGKIVHFRDCAVPFTASNQKKLEVDVVNLLA